MMHLHGRALTLDISKSRAIGPKGWNALCCRLRRSVTSHQYRWQEKRDLRKQSQTRDTRKQDQPVGYRCDGGFAKRHLLFRDRDKDGQI